jgi:DNA topoisomerase VI subunit B
LVSEKADDGDRAARMPKQRDIAVSEFFAKNRHLLGFDSPQKALLTAVREAVDNALDACEEARILPEIDVELEEVKEGRFRVKIEDNGPGIPKPEMGKIFAKLLYGSKFHRLRQSRGQQGIGISAAVMYAQMTTGEPATVVSKTGKGRPAHRVRLYIDTKKNAPEIEREDVATDDHWRDKESGTSVELIMSASFKGGRQGIEAYLKQTALANTHAVIRYKNHKGQLLALNRVVHVLPVEPKEIKPHPHGVELGTLQRMLHDAGTRPVAGFLTDSFSRVSAQQAEEMVRGAGLTPRATAGKITRAESEALFFSIQNQKLMAPPTNCLSPIGEEALIKGLYALFGDATLREDGEDDELVVHKPPTILPQPAAEAEAPPIIVETATVKAKRGKKAQPDLFAPVDVPQPAPVVEKPKLTTDEEGAVVLAGEGTFVTAVTRPPAVYRGNPFQVEAAILYSKALPGDELARVFRFANRVPLLYQASACAMQKAVVSAPWRSYEVQQAKGALPMGPLVIIVHIASAWVPYTSESKEAIAHYPEVLKEMRLAVMEAGRRLQRFLRRRRRDADEEKKKSYITKYLDPIGEALQEILGLSEAQRDDTMESLKIVLEKSRAKGDDKDERLPRPRKKKGGEASAD